MRVVYISYTGLLEPLGESQVWSYLKRLATWHQIDLVTFEKKAELVQQCRLEELHDACQSAGIRWEPLVYHRTPSVPATLFDVSSGTRAVKRSIAKTKPDILHCRGYIATLIGYRIFKQNGIPFIFDMRGFWPEEKVAAGNWHRNGVLHRVVKTFESRFLRNAAAVVVLTEKAKEVLISRGRSAVPGAIHTIPTCVDLDRFTPRVATGNRRAFHLGYVGSASGRYALDESLRFYSKLRVFSPGARLTILNQRDQGMIRDRIFAQGLQDAPVEVRAVPHRNMPAELRRFDAGIAFYKPSMNTLATSPTKVGEFLACGVPVITNEGVGDVPSLLHRNHVGVTVPGFEEEQLVQGVELILDLASSPGLAHRCRSVAKRVYALASGVERYDQIYRSLESMLVEQ